MTTLYARATPQQSKMLRMISGAVRNAAHAHPQWNIDPRFATSIAKRATGTLTAQWRDVLAASKPSECGGEKGKFTPTHGPALAGATPGGASYAGWRSPLRCAFWAIGKGVQVATGEGDHVRADAYRDVLRLLAQIIDLPEAPAPGARFVFPVERDSS